MNPIIVIGMVSLIALGLYGIYAGLAQQAELGEIQRDMLERAGVSGPSSSSHIRGEIHDGAHVILTSNVARDIVVIQFRGYENGTLSGAWHVNYTVRAYQTQNLTGGAGGGTDPPPPLPGDMTALLGDEDHTFRGVTAQGAIFAIGRAAPSETSAPADTFGHVAVMGIDGGSASQSGAGTVIAYHHSDSSILCKVLFAKPGESWHTRWEKHIIYDAPFLVSDGGIGGATPGPAGSPAWYYWEEGEKLKPGRHKIYDHCSNFGHDTRALARPANIAPLQGHPGVFQTVRSSADYNVGVTFPISGNVTAPYAGKMAVRVETPLAWSAGAGYDFDAVFRCVDTSAHTTNPCDCLSEFHDTVDDRLTAWEERMPRPSFSASVRVQNGGQTVQSAPPGAGAPAESLVRDVELARTGFDTYYYNCVYRLTGNIEAAWSYGGRLDGWLETDVEAGDVITVNGQISVSYGPGGFADGTPSSSRVGVDVGDTILTVGRLNE
ncbi:MAG: hypothetical protein OXI27_03980 [Thaumarchaeota archaeon]|nr:hypothetical protein [Nitrososphaerota archaeon]